MDQQGIVGIRRIDAVGKFQSPKKLLLSFFLPFLYGRIRLTEDLFLSVY